MWVVSYQKSLRSPYFPVTLIYACDMLYAVFLPCKIFRAFVSCLCAARRGRRTAFVPLVGFRRCADKEISLSFGRSRSSVLHVRKTNIPKLPGLFSSELGKAEEEGTAACFLLRRVFFLVSLPASHLAPCRWGATTARKEPSAGQHHCAKCKV